MERKLSSVAEVVAIMILMTCVASAQERNYSYDSYEDCFSSCGYNYCDVPPSTKVMNECITLCDEKCSGLIGPGGHH